MTVSCAHADFEADVAVVGLIEREGGPVTGYAIEVQVHCSACGTRAVFLGPTGSSAREPRVSFDGFTLRAPASLENAGASLAERLVPSSGGEA